MFQFPSNGKAYLNFKVSERILYDIHNGSENKHVIHNSIRNIIQRDSAHLLDCWVYEIPVPDNPAMLFDHLEL